MPEVVDVPLSDLLFDLSNPRLVEPLKTQQEFAVNLAKQQQGNIVRLAKDILDNGLDPTTLPAVIPTDDQHKRYTVLEGNRRVLALKALEAPALVAPALSQQDQRRLTQLAERFSAEPLKAVSCVLFANEQEATHWIELRHTGQNEGVGLVPWGSDEKDRYQARQANRSPEGQIIDFVERYGDLSDEARRSSKGIRSSLKRLVSTPQVREALGVDITNGTVIANYPKDEMSRVFTRLLENLKTGQLPTQKIYDVNDRTKWVKTLSSEDKPKPSKKLKTAVTLQNLGTGTTTTETPTPRKRRRRRQTTRTSLIPRTTQLSIDPPRINAIYTELSQISVDQYANACSVLFRVFVELSVDHYVKQNKLMTETDMQNKPLAMRMKTAATHLKKLNKIDADLQKAVDRMGGNKVVLAASSTVTMNQYVHNQYVFPQPTELRIAWDEIEPFIVKLWEP